MFGIIPFRTNNSNEKGGSLENLLGDFFNDDFLSPLSMEMNKFNADIKETDNEYIVCAELPGVNKKDINLDYKNSNLIISAKREESHNEKEDSYIRKERSYGEFSRSFYFDNIEQDKISAKFDNGELRIILPKKVKKQDKSMNINIE